MADLASSDVAAGFPSPVDGHVEKDLDLNDFLVKHPAATFFVRVSGDSMIGAAIQSGDLLIVDRSAEARDGKVVVAIVDGEFTVKRLSLKNGYPQLIAENPAYPPISISEGCEFQVWGVVTHVIHQVR